MNEFLLNRALTQIDDRYLTMADQTVKEVQTMRQKHFSTRKLVRTILIAAVITALLGITAYAFSSIHTARQQRLRAELQIEENNVSGYTEYAENAAEENTEDDTRNPGTWAASTPLEGKIQLISSIQQGDFQMVYFSVAPVPVELARSFIFENMETLFVYIISNQEIPEESWYSTGGNETGMHKGSVYPVPYTEGHESEHMIEMSSQTGLPDENGVQGTVTFEVVDPAWRNPLLLDYSYDSETQSLMLMCGIYREQVDGSRPVYFSVRCLDGRSVWMDADTTIEEYEANYSPVYLADYGTAMLEMADTDFVSALLPEPIRLLNPENGGRLDILEIRLSANCAEWRIAHDDAELIYNLDPESPSFHEDFEKQLQWIRFQDAILSGASLNFEDGSTLPLSSSPAAPYENGITTLTSSWSGTIDIGKVKSITVMGEEYPFPELSTEN